MKLLKFLGLKVVRVKNISIFAVPIIGSAEEGGMFEERIKG